MSWITSGIETPSKSKVIGRCGEFEPLWNQRTCKYTSLNHYGIKGHVSKRV